MKPHGTSEGPGEAVATTGAKRGAVTGTLGQVTGKSVLKEFRARDRMERDSNAASFRFNYVDDELQAKLGRGERLFRQVGMVRSGLD